MVLELKFGQMGLNMKDNGKIIKLKEKVRFGMQKVMFMMENFKMIKQMDMEYIHMLMDQDMKDFGKMIYRKVTVVKFGVMELNIQELI